MAKPATACIARIMPDGWHAHNCGSNGAVQHEGKWYCRRHDPAKLADKRARRDALYKAKWKEDEAATRVDELERHLLSLLCDGTGADTCAHGALQPAWLTTLIPKLKAARAKLALARDERIALERK